MAPSREEIEALIDFQSFLNDAAGTHSAAVLGIGHARAWYQSEVVEKAPDPERYIILGHGDPADPDTRGYQAWKIGSLPERLADDGPVVRELGRQWAVSIYAQWEHVCRPAVAAARSVERKDVRDDLMGEIRHIRHDILHHHGVATADHCGRCKLLVWFAAGDEIVIDRRRVAEFMGHVGLTYRIAQRWVHP